MSEISQRLNVDVKEAFSFTPCLEFGEKTIPGNDYQNIFGIEKLYGDPCSD